MSTVYIKNIDETILSIDITSKDTVGTLKQKIHNKQQIASPNIQVVRSSITNEILDDDDEPLYHYGIINESTCLLSLQSTICIMALTGKRMPIQVVPHLDTVKTIKTKLFNNEGIPPPIQSLISRPENYEMSNDRLLNYYGINHESEIYLILRTKRYMIMIDENEYLYQHFKETEYTENDKTVKDLKIAIGECMDEENIEFCKNYDLFCNDKKCNDDELMSYGWDTHDGFNTEFALTTNDGILWYKENKRIIYNEMCNLLVFGYIRLCIVNQYEFNKEMEYSEITKICKLFYHSIYEH